MSQIHKKYGTHEETSVNCEERFQEQIHADKYEEFEKLYRPEKRKTVVAFFLLFFGTFINAALLSGIQPLLPEQPHLPDVAFMLFGQHKWAWVLSDFMIGFHLVVGVTLLAFHKYRWIVFRRVFIIGAVLFYLRASCLAVTFLPSSFKNSKELCTPIRTYDNAFKFLRSLFRYMATFGLTSAENVTLCGDLMFSGHTFVICLVYFAILHYTPKGMKCFRRFITPISYLAMFTVLLSGGHYTIDILIAYWLASHIFWSYHQLFDVDLITNVKLDPENFQQSSSLKNAPLRNVWWFWLAKWFETGVPRREIPNELNWPFNWK